MRNLGRPLLRLLGRDDRGAVGVLVAVLIGFGVLLGMGALAIDVGQIYQNRAELQNGADSAALAIATQCAEGTCPSSPLTTAGTYANANASALTQGTAGISVVCGSDGLGSCASVVGTGLTNCPADPTGSGAHFVDVQTETKLGSGSNLLPPVFAKTLVGNSTYNGTTVKACAQAQWGQLAGLAFTISTCEWNTAISNPANAYWNPSPPYSASDQSTWPSASVAADVAYDKTFIIHSGSNDPGTTTCQDDNAHQDAPGAFGWTDDPGHNCLTPITTDASGVQTYGVQPGTPAKDCADYLRSYLANATYRPPVLVPVYSQVGCCGAGTRYTFQGFASFVITGFRVDSLRAQDWLNPSLTCGPPFDCINGFFTSGVLSKTMPPGSLNSVKLTG